MAPPSGSETEETAALCGRRGRRRVQQPQFVRFTGAQRRRARTSGGSQGGANSCSRPAHRRRVARRYIGAPADGDGIACKCSCRPMLHPPPERRKQTELPRITRSYVHLLSTILSHDDARTLLLDHHSAAAASLPPPLVLALPHAQQSRSSVPLCSAGWLLAGADLLWGKKVLLVGCC